jgi:hypothetical protein
VPVVSPALIVSTLLLTSRPVGAPRTAWRLLEKSTTFVSIFAGWASVTVPVTRWLTDPFAGLGVTSTDLISTGTTSPA